MVKKAKPAPKKAPASSSTTQESQAASSALQLLDTTDYQRLLNIFSDAFSTVLLSDSFPALLQEVKQALYNRDFDAAFGKEEYLEAYAARWSPTRAMCYATVFGGIKEHLDEIQGLKRDDAGAVLRSGTEIEPSDDAVRKYEPVARSRMRMLSIGGCAAEHVAFASYIHQTSSDGELILLDSAPWSAVTDRLQTHITTPPQLSKYASAAAKASNKALLNAAQLETRFAQHDVLDLVSAEHESNKAKLQELVGTTEPLLISLMFTLNELYTNGGIGKTTKFLRRLGEVAPNKTLLLVVDSPGSYSEAALGKEKKRYPMQWLLDHTLLETESEGYKWEKLESQDSVWFRLPEGLSYPIPLENMRYQVHLYRLNKA